MQAWLSLACASIAFLSAGCSSGGSGDAHGSGAPSSSSSTTSAPETPLPASEQAPSCASDADCQAGTVCFYDQPSCDPAVKAGHCHEPRWSHECAVNIPTCSCDGRTQMGNNCADVVRTRWKDLRECSCKTDSDCHGGQACYFGRRGCEATGQCRDPAIPKCSQFTQTICTCAGKTVKSTCVGEMKQPWSETAPCGAPRK